MSACRRRRYRTGLAGDASTALPAGVRRPVAWRRWRSDSAPTSPRWSSAKAALGTSISVCLPARNEEATVGQIVATVRRNLVERAPLVDEVVVIDDGSTDATAEAAGWRGRARAAGRRDPPRPPRRVAARATRCGCRSTRARATSSAGSTPTSATSAPHFVTRLLEPLLTDPDDRVREGLLPPAAATARPTGGGRVTELMARPLLSALFPHLAGFVQPLAGEYAGRREPARVGARSSRARASRSGCSSTSSPASASTRSRRSTSTCASTATARSTSSGPRRWRCSSPGCGAPACRSTGAWPSWCATTRAAPGTGAGGDPRAPADGLDPRLPREVRPRAVGLKGPTGCPCTCSSTST